MLFTIVKIAKYLAMLGICASFFVCVYRLLKRTVSLGELAKNEVTERIVQDGKASELKLEMSRYGVMYRMENYNLSPTWYVIFRLGVGLGIMALLLLVGVRHILVLAAVPAGYYGVLFLFKKLNEEDNKQMLMDVFNTYANINIQLKVGLYIADALEYTYHVAKNKRYKEALGELVLNMSDKTITMEESVSIFNSRFASEEIDKLCNMIKMILRYGSNAGYSQNLMEEIKSIIHADALRAESDIDTKANMISFAFFAVIIVIVAVTIFTNFSGVDVFS